MAYIELPPVTVSLLTTGLVGKNLFFYITFTTYSIIEHDCVAGTWTMIFPWFLFLFLSIKDLFLPQTQQH